MDQEAGRKTAASDPYEINEMLLAAKKQLSDFEDQIEEIQKKIEEIENRGGEDRAPINGNQPVLRADGAERPGHGIDATGSNRLFEDRSRRQESSAGDRGEVTESSGGNRVFNGGDGEGAHRHSAKNAGASAKNFNSDSHHQRSPKFSDLETGRRVIDSISNYSSNIRLLAEKSDTIQSRRDPQYGKSISVICEEIGRFRPDRSKDRGGDLGSEIRVSRLADTLEKNLTEGYYRIEISDIDGGKKRTGKLTKQEAVEIASSPMKEGSKSKRHYMDENGYRETQLKITAVRPPIRQIATTYLTEISEKVSEKFTDISLSIYDKIVLQPMQVAEKWKKEISPTEMLERQKKIISRNRSLLQKFPKNREAAEELIKAFKLLDKSKADLRSFKVEKWAQERMVKNPFAVAATLRALSGQSQRIKAPRKFADAIFRDAREHGSVVKTRNGSKTKKAQVGAKKPLGTPQKTKNNSGQEKEEAPELIKAEIVEAGGRDQKSDRKTIAQPQNERSQDNPEEKLSLEVASLDGSAAPSVKSPDQSSEEVKKEVSDASVRSESLENKEMRAGDGTQKKAPAHDLKQIFGNEFNQETLNNLERSITHFSTAKDTLPGFEEFDEKQFCADCHEEKIHPRYITDVFRKIVSLDGSIDGFKVYLKDISAIYKNPQNTIEAQNKSVMDSIAKIIDTAIEPSKISDTNFLDWIAKNVEGDGKGISDAYMRFCDKAKNLKSFKNFDTKIYLQKEIEKGGDEVVGAITTALRYVARKERGVTPALLKKTIKKQCSNYSISGLGTIIEKQYLGLPDGEKKAIFDHYKEVVATDYQRKRMMKKDISISNVGGYKPFQSWYGEKRLSISGATPPSIADTRKPSETKIRKRKYDDSPDKSNVGSNKFALEFHKNDLIQAHSIARRSYGQRYNPDFVDYQTAKKLFQKGVEIKTVAEVLRKHSPNLKNRKGDESQQYVETTVKNAALKAQEERSMAR